MPGERVLLTINTVMYKALKKKAEDNLMTIQELIADTLRKSILASGKSKKQKTQFIDYFSRRR